MNTAATMTPAQLPPMLVLRLDPGRADDRCFLFLKCDRAGDGWAFVPMLDAWVGACERCATRLGLTFEAACPECDGTGERAVEGRVLVCFRCDGSGSAKAPDLAKIGVPPWLAGPDAGAGVPA